jgi:creatinine amidohydrolase/Fe(II)-dependent formamide hydrolase-like protein
MRRALCFVTMYCLLVPLAQGAVASVFLDDLTWTEVRAAQKAGTTTIIIPVGGTEQNGPHMVLGKHNVRVHALAGRIATLLGNALVAPVVAYVPEGTISPPSGHMRFPGTISIPDAAFQSTLEAAAKSFSQNGFTDIVLIGDSGNYQNQLKAVASRLNRAWAATPARAHFVDEYYRASQSAYTQALRAKGLTDSQIGTHAGAADTSLLIAIDPSRVRSDRLETAHAEGAAGGASGDPRASSAALGQLGVDLIVSRSVEAIRKARKASR